MPRWLTPLVLLALACRTSADAPTDTDVGPDDTEVGESDAPDTVVDDSDVVTTHPGDDVEIAALDGVDVSFTGEVNRREVDVDVTFPPADETFEAIELRMAVKCPAGGRCDPWDRWGFLGVLVDGGTDAPPQVLELTRFVTPYGVGDDWTLDVTDLRPLLTGDVTLRVFIDTWVGPGSPYGDGWAVDATFAFAGGTPPRQVLGVLPAFGPRGVAYGDPARPTSTQQPPVDVPLPSGTREVRVRSFVTGHGQGNADNCAEFCARDHTLTAGDTARTKAIWRDDCRSTAAPNQQGTWQYARAGWCPGADVRAWSFLAPAPSTGPLTIAWDVEPWENTCRPDAEVCGGCTLGTGCGYDGGAHTEPTYHVSAAVIAYGDVAP